MEKDTTSFVNACLDQDLSAISSFVNDRFKERDPEYLWASLFHAATWNEQRVYDTAHSTILVHATHEMVSALGDNPSVTETRNEFSLFQGIPQDIRFSLQYSLIEHLALNLASVDHWEASKGPPTEKLPLMTINDVRQEFLHPIRTRNFQEAYQAAYNLWLKGPHGPLEYSTLHLAAENPDSLGHGFILPASLILELPGKRFPEAAQDGLWHLTEFLIRKSNQIVPLDFPIDDFSKAQAKPIQNILSQREIISTALNYGVLGHHGIFAHRIVEIGNQGLLDHVILTWLVKRLEMNMGESFPLVDWDKKDLVRLLKPDPQCTWRTFPDELELVHASKIHQWIQQNLNDVWNAMFESDYTGFIKLVHKSDPSKWGNFIFALWDLVTSFGNITQSHPIIFTHAMWDLANRGSLYHPVGIIRAFHMIRNYLH